MKNPCDECIVKMICDKTCNLKNNYDKTLSIIMKIYFHILFTIYIIWFGICFLIGHKINITWIIFGLLNYSFFDEIYSCRMVAAYLLGPALTCAILTSRLFSMIQDRKLIV